MSDDAPSKLPVLPGPLLESARAEFLAHGFADANIGRIAAAAGMSKKTIYKYVPSKEALFLALVEAVLSGQVLVLDVLDPEAPPVARLTTYVRAFAQLAFSEVGITSYRFVMREGIRFPAMARRYIEMVNRYSVDILANELLSYAAAHRVRIADANAATQMLLAMIISVPLRDAALGLALPPHGKALDDSLDKALAIFLHGVGRDAGFGS